MKGSLPCVAACILAALLLLACTPGRDRLRSGDLVFVGIPADYRVDDSMDAAIAASTGAATGLNLIHVAIAEVQADSVWIIDATLRRGVDRHPLADFLSDFTLRDGSLPTFVVKRLHKPFPVEESLARARALCGVPYDTLFLAGNEARYCSELVRDCYLDAEGRHLFEEQPMNWLDADGNMPPYWTWLFGQMGMEVPQGQPGTNPQDMARSPLLREVKVSIP